MSFIFSDAYGCTEAAALIYRQITYRTSLTDHLPKIRLIPGISSFITFLWICYTGGGGEAPEDKNIFRKRYEGVAMATNDFDTVGGAEKPAY